MFHTVTEALVLIFPTLYAMTGGLLLQWWLGYNFSVAVWVGYIALFRIAVETGVVMVVYLHEALDQRLSVESALQRADIEKAAIEGAVQRLRPKLMTVAAVLASSCADPLGDRRWIRCDETHCRADCRRHDHVDNSRADSGSGLFRDDENARTAPGAASESKRNRFLVTIEPDRIMRRNAWYSQLIAPALPIHPWT